MLLWVFLTIFLNLTCNNFVLGQLRPLGSPGIEPPHSDNKNIGQNSLVAANSNVLGDQKKQDETIVGNSNAPVEIKVQLNGSSVNNQNKEESDKKVPNTNSNQVPGNEKDHENKANAENKNDVNKKKDGTEMSTVTTNIKKYSKDLIQSGALLRGFYVFLGLSAVVVFYFIFRSYRLRHGSQVSTTVKKYGVTARRSDLEMRRLELDDDDDDTLFEINQNVNR
ncbi:hypothetical protein RI129_003406 [Pyrocoelia pectoralis]|uniref:Uncharacterized protein n=1 Tax=Pyrocoelia pectoralis TaxID=417401 RepID=A0AAN7VRR1_9COLE